MKRKSNQFSVRLDPQLQADVEQCCKITGMDPALFMREAFKAFVDEVHDKGEIRLPIAIVPKSTKQVSHHAPKPEPVTMAAGPATPASIVRPRTDSTPSPGLNETPGAGIPHPRQPVRYGKQVKHKSP